MAIREEFEKHFNEPVLVMDRLARVIGYGEDEMDCYLIVQFLGGAVIWHTAVGGYYWLDRLKGQQYVKAHNGEDWDDLVRLDGDLTRGGAPKRDTFMVEIDTTPYDDAVDHEMSLPLATT